MISSGTPPKTGYFVGYFGHLYACIGVFGLLCRYSRRGVLFRLFGVLRNADRGTRRTPPRPTVGEQSKTALFSWFVRGSFDFLPRALGRRHLRQFGRFPGFNPSAARRGCSSTVTREYFANIAPKSHQFNRVLNVQNPNHKKPKPGKLPRV